MKKKSLDFGFCLFCVICMIFIFQNNQEVANTIINAVDLFLRKVFVSLFPMFIINDILIGLNVPVYFYRLFNGFFQKIFKTSGISAYVFVMSLISGTPSNAYILKNLVLENKLTVLEANHYLYFTYFSNPLFLSLMLGSIFESKIVLKIILVHYISNIIIGIIIRNKAPKISTTKVDLKDNNLGSVLIKSINRSISTLLMILGTLVFYMLITYIITNLGNFNNLFKTIMASCLEITNGLNMLSKLEISLKLKEIMAIAAISFGGLSINTQIKAILEDTKLNYQCFFKGRIMQVLISVLIIFFI